MNKKIDSWIELNRDFIIDLRRWLHQNPELGFQEHNTSNHLQSILSKNDYSIIQNKDMETGFYCDYGEGFPRLALRTDMDALEVFEENHDKKYRSQNEGIMHACGHDVHMTILTSIAVFLRKNNIPLNGSIRFIFQPAEEKAPGGAISMIKGKAIDAVDNIVGSHVLPKMNAGKVAIKYGPMAATVELIDITLEGEGGHTSRPNESVDLIWAQSQLVHFLEQSLNHGIDKKEPVVLAFGKIEGGTTHNVLPNKVKLFGTLRYLNPDIKYLLYKKINNSVKNVMNLSNAKIKWKSNYACPGVVNDDKLTDLIYKSAKEAIGEENVELLDVSSMGGEDFAYYLEKISGTYFRIGSYDGKCKDIHTPDFDVNEDCIFTGIKVYSSIIDNYFRL